VRGSGAGVFSGHSALNHELASGRSETGKNEKSTHQNVDMAAKKVAAEQGKTGYFGQFLAVDYAVVAIDVSGACP
jgi:hypothetical protein